MLMFFIVVFDLFVAFVCAASAQTKPATPPPRTPSGPRFDVSIGAGFLSGSSLGGGDAELRARSGQSFELFGTSTRIAASVPIEGRLTFLLGSRYALEFRGAWARPELRTEITGDVEGAPAQTVAEQVSLYSIDGGLLIALRPARPGVIAPFISGGAGYVAAVHEELTLLENGVVYRVGGGFKYPIAARTQRRLKGYGLRADAGLAVMTGGVTTAADATRQLSASGSFYLVF
jgi:hypothetical protein